MADTDVVVDNDDIDDDAGMSDRSNDVWLMADVAAAAAVSSLPAQTERYRRVATSSARYSHALIQLNHRC